MCKLKILEKEIQYWREILHKLISYNSLTDSTVVSCSHKLDKLLTEYEIAKLNCDNCYENMQLKII